MCTPLHNHTHMPSKGMTMILICWPGTRHFLIPAPKVHPPTSSSLARSLAHSLTTARMHACTHTHALTHTPTRSLTHSLTHSPTHSLARLLARPHPPTYSPNDSCMHSCAHALARSPTHPLWLESTLGISYRGILLTATMTTSLLPFTYLC